MTPTYTTTAIGLNSAEAERILEHAGAETRFGERLDRISKFLIGRPYAEGALGGGPRLAEEFRVSLSAFDCVTFMEIVLALALARTIDEFTKALRRIRYENGEVDWFSRNHYMVDWASRNEARGFIRNITYGPDAAEKTCTLGLIEGLQAKTATFGYFPTESYEKVAGRIETGDLICFVSTRDTLDVFHTGVLIERDGGNVLMRHATRRAGAVIEQQLIEFMSQNKMAGFTLLRPLCQR